MTNFVYAYPVIFDNEGRPLDGRLDFFEPGTSTPKNVFDVSGNSLGSSIETTASGFAGSHQIFIDGNTDCKVYRGDDFQYTMRLIDTTNDSAVYPSTSLEVGSVADLRELEIPEDGAVVSMTGREVPGDMTTQVYIYSESSTATDDGASVIKPTDASTSGRWLLIPGWLIDCRLFGIVPDTDVNLVEPSSLTALFAYCDSVGRDAWFPALKTSGNTYYALTAGSYTLHTKMVVDRGVHFRNSASTNSVTLVVDGGIDTAGMKFDYGSFSVTAPEFRTSWIGTADVTPAPSERLVVDESHPISASNVRVDVLVDLTAVAEFNNSEINCEYRLPVNYGVGFTDCKVSDRFFKNPASINMNLVSLSGCIFDINDFLRTSNWAAFNIKQGNNVLDFGGRSVQSLDFSASAVEVSNVHVSSVTLQNTVQNSIFRSCVIGSFNWGGGNAAFESCSISFSHDMDVGDAILTFKDGSLTGANLAEISCGTANVRNSGVACGISAKVLNIVGCEVSGVLESRRIVEGVNAYYTFKLVGNDFIGSGQHKVSAPGSSYPSGGSEKVTGGIWKDNHFGGANPGIDINLAAFYNGQSEYLYEGNTGNIVPTKVKGVSATSYSVDESMRTGFRILPYFSTNAQLFILGQKSVRVTVRVQIMDVFNAVASAFVEKNILSHYGVVLGGYAVCFRDFENELGTEFRLIASGGVYYPDNPAGNAFIVADAEVL